LEQDSLAQARAALFSHPKPHLPSKSTWQHQSSPQTPKIVDEVSISPVLGSTSGHSGQPGQENRRHRRCEIRETSGTVSHGEPDSPEELARYLSTGTEGMDTKAWEAK